MIYHWLRGSQGNMLWNGSKLSYRPGIAPWKEVCDAAQSLWYRRPEWSLHGPALLPVISSTRMSDSPAGHAHWHRFACAALAACQLDDWARPSPAQSETLAHPQGCLCWAEDNCALQSPTKLPLSPAEETERTGNLTKRHFGLGWGGTRWSWGSLLRALTWRLWSMRVWPWPPSAGNTEQNVLCWLDLNFFFF